MIASLEIIDPEDTPVKWWKDVPALHEPRTIKFKPGVNILWGPNGSGKSTLLLALARLTHSDQGGTSVITKTSIKHLFDSELRRETGPRHKLREGLKLAFDGQPVVYIDPNAHPGLIGGMAGFDYDFMDEIGGSMGRNHISSGQRALSSFQKKRPATIKKKDVWDGHEDLPAIKKLLKATIKKGPLTTLMDEPEANFDWPNRLTFWDVVMRSPHQHIIATHSPFALRLTKHVNLIELQPGYAEECREVLKISGLWALPSSGSAC